MFINLFAVLDKPRDTADPGNSNSYCAICVGAAGAKIDMIIVLALVLILVLVQLPMLLLLVPVLALGSFFFAVTDS